MIPPGAASWMHALADVLLPEVCAVCGDPSVTDPWRLCAPCAATLRPLDEPFCPRCSLPYDGVGPSHLCPRCLRHVPPFVRLRGYGRYEGALRRAVQGLKYGRRHALRRLLTALFLDGLTRHGVASAGLNAVVSVPCHGATLRERGLDLPALLSRAAAETLGVPWRPQALERRDPSVHLAGLSLRERRRAVRGLYGVRQSLSGAILLVDDVVTSTSTVRAAAKACLAAGAERVFVQALARTPTHPQK